jgi:hypothetical protein
MEICIKPSDDVNMIDNNAQMQQEDEIIISKYADKLDTITPEFINTLPLEEQVVIKKIIEQQNQILPNDTPFTLVQSKNKTKATKTTTPTSTPSTPNQINTFEFGTTKTGSRSSTPIKTNKSQSIQQKIVYGRGGGRGGSGRGGGLITNKTNTKTELTFPTLQNQPKNPVTLNNHPHNTNNYNNDLLNNRTITLNNATDTKNITNTNNIIMRKTTNNSKLNTTTSTNDTNNSITNTTQTIENNTLEEPISAYTNMKASVENRYTYCIHISAKQTKNSETISRESVAEHILQSFIKAEAYTAIATTTANSYQRQVTQSLYKPNSNELIPNSKKFLNELNTTIKGNISANLWISSDIPYASLKRIYEFKKTLINKVLNSHHG